MSKILVDSEELHNLISRAYEVIYSTPYVHPYTNQAKKASEILDDALDLIEKQEFEQRHFSVLKWHPYPEEKPTRKGMFLAAYQCDSVSTLCIYFDGKEFSFEDGCLAPRFWAEIPMFDGGDGFQMPCMQGSR